MAVVVIGVVRFHPLFSFHAGNATRSNTIPHRENAPKENASIDDKHSLLRSAWSAANANPFRLTSFLATPVPPPVLAQVSKVEEQKPSAPPFPYEFLGRMTDVDGNALTFLTRNGDLTPVKEGEVLDGIYRIDSVDERQIIITFIPTNEQSALIAKTAEH